MRHRAVHAAAILAFLGVVAYLSPLPNRVTDRDVYEATAAQRIVPDCTDIHCFRVLVPWVLGSIPGPSVAKWKAYAVVCNAAAALFVFELCLTFGLSRRAASIACVLTAGGFGSLYTLHDSYTADPLMYALGPLMLNELLRERFAAATAIGAVGVLAKEFAAAPLFVFTLFALTERRWTFALRTLVAANLVLIVWLVLQFTLMLRFNYGYGNSTSIHLLSGGGVVPWHLQQSPRGALSAVFNEFGALYLLAPAGFVLAPARLRRLTLAAAPAAAVFAYVQQPDRALWNFHFLVVPLAAIGLERAPQALAWLTVAAFALANLRIGAQLTIAPAARFGLACSVLLAIVSIVAVWRSGGTSPRPARSLNAVSV